MSSMPHKSCNNKFFPRRGDYYSLRSSGCNCQHRVCDLIKNSLMIQNKAILQSRDVYANDVSVKMLSRLELKKLFC